MSIQSSVSLSLPEKVSAALGQSVAITVGITDFSGQDREVLVRLIGSLTGPLPAISHSLIAHLSIQVELPMSVPAGMPPGDHPILIEVLDRSSGVVIGSGEVFLEVQRTRSVAMHLSPPSIRRRLRGKIRVVIRNHDDQTHFIRLRTESDDQQSKIHLLHQEIELRAGEMVRIKGRLRVKPFFVGKQKEHWYSIIGEGAGAPIYGRGNIRHIPMIGRNIKSIMGLMCIVLVWAGATLAILKQVNPVTKDSTASAAGTTDPESGNGTDTDPGGSLDLPTLIDVSGTVTAVPDGSGVVVNWRSITIGDVEGTGKVSPTASTGNPKIANLSTTTDEKGSFSVAGLDASGIYEFTFSKAGHKTKKIIVQPNGEAVTLEVALEVGDGLISGITVDEKGNPLGGANVTLSDGNITYQTTTPSEGDHIGEFAFNNLSTPATWVVDAQSDGRGLASTIINLNAGGQQLNVSLSLSPDVTSIEGTVTSTYFDTESIVTITATDGVITRTTSTLTNRDSNLAGRFILTDLPVGRTFTITYVADGYQTKSEQLEITINSVQRVIEMRLSTGSMNGYVDGPSDFSKVAISISNDSNSYKSTNLVASNGFYQYSNIEPGHYVVTFVALGFDPFITEVDIAADATKPLDGVLTQISNTPTNFLNFQVSTSDATTPNWSVKIRYRPQDECGTSSNANFKIIANCEYQVSNGVTNTFIDGLNPGAYYLVFDAEGYATKVVQVDSKAPKTKGDQESVTTITLTAKGTLTGQATDSTGAPVQGLAVILKSSTGAVIAEGRTNADGEYKGADGTQIFDQKLQNATYSLEIGSDTYTAVTRTVVGSEATTINVDIKVNAVSLIAGEVRSLNVSSGNYDAADPNNFFVYYRKHSDTSETNWLKPEENMGISKSLGTYRLSINPYATPNDANPTPYDVCIVVKKEQSANTPEVNCSSSTDLTTKVFEKIVLNRGGVSINSTYSTPNPGSLSGSVTVNGTRTKGVLVEARRVVTGKTVESFSQTTNEQGDFSFTSLTPTGVNAPAVLDDPTCDNQLSSCWIISIADQLYEASESNLVSVYPNKVTKVTQALATKFKTGKVLIYLRDSSGLASNAQVVEVLESGKTSNLCTDALDKTKQPTGANGVCLINDVQSGFHTYEASKTGVNTSTISLTVIGGQENFASGFLTANTGDLSVTLQDTKGMLVSGVVITATDSQGNPKSCTTRTSAEKQSNLGSCVIEGLSFGTVSVKSTETNALSSVSGTTSIGSGGAALTLTAVSRYGTLNLSFFDSSANQVFGANASVSSLSCLAPEDKNSCEIENVPEGSQIISYHKDGFLDSNLQITVIRGTNTAIRITLFKSTSPLKGYVYQEQGCEKSTKAGCTAIPNAIVSTNTSTGLSAFTVTDTYGFYSFENLNPGTWKIQTNAYGYARMIESSVTVPVVDNADVNLFLTALPGSLELTLLTPVGTTISDIKVELTPSIPSDTSPRITENAGQAFFTNRPAGIYTVVISDSYIPARYTAQTFQVKIDRNSTTRFNVYLGTYGSFISIPVVGIPASTFGPSTPLSVDVALMNASNNVVYTSPTQNVGAQKLASFAGVSDGTYRILIVNSFAPIAISAITTGNPSTTYETSVNHQLTTGDSVTISGVGQTGLNATIASITKISDTKFSITKNSSGTTVPSDLSNAVLTKLDTNNWNTNSHDIAIMSGGVTNTYVVPSPSSVLVANANSRTLTLDPISLTVKPVDFNVTVTGILYPDTAVTTTSNPTSTTLPLLNNANVTLSDGYLLNSVSSRTNPSGIAEFTKIPPGTYTATVTNTSYDEFVTTVTIVDFANPSGNNPRISLNQTATVGRINVSVYGDGDPNSRVSGATVSVLQNNTSCVTAIDGTCILYNLPQGNYDLRVAHPLYIPMETDVNQKIHVTGGLETLVPFGLGSATGKVDFTVFDSTTGGVLNNAQVTRQSGNTVGNCSTLVSGKCSIEGLPLGSTNFKIESSNFDTGYAVIDVTGGISSKISISLLPSLATTNTLKVRVIDAISSLAIDGALVTNSVSEATLCTSVTGECVASQIAVGNLAVKAALANYEPAYASVVISSSSQTTLVFVLRPISSTLNVTVLTSFSTTSVNGATVKFGETVCANTATSGSYLCSNLSSGVGTLTVSKGDFYSSATAIISIANGSQNYVTVYLVQFGDLIVTAAQQVTQIDVSVTGLTQTCSIIGTGTTTTSSTPNSSCQMLKLPYGSWVIKLSSGQSSSVTINSDSKSITIS